MKVLVYGSGVIGSYLAHVLCAAGNDVTMLARGKWKEQLEKNGLRIRHHLQHKETLDHPAVIEEITDDQEYDIVFAVMPYNKMRAILEPLAAIHAPIVVLVGNNMSPADMQREILDHSACEKQVLFGFQATEGKRDHEKGMLICERAGVGAMDIGGLHSLPGSGTKAKLETSVSDLPSGGGASHLLSGLCLQRGSDRLHWETAKAHAHGLPGGVHDAEGAGHPNSAGGRRSILRPRNQRHSHAVSLLWHGQVENRRGSHRL